MSDPVLIPVAAPAGAAPAGSDPAPVAKVEKLVPSIDPSLMHSVPSDIFVNFEDRMCDMTCRKCDEVPLIPISLPCGCAFCKGCFDKLVLLEKCSSCDSPFAREEKKIITAPAFMITGKLKNQEVKCLHEGRGCKEKIIYGINGERFFAHLKDCKFALVGCVDCNAVMSKAAYTIHKPNAEVCPDFVTVCHICGNPFRKEDTVQHKKSAEHVFKAVELMEKSANDFKILEDRLESYAGRMNAAQRVSAKQIEELKSNNRDCANAIIELTAKYVQMSKEMATMKGGMLP
ncbi:MAG: serine/arginine-rich splicing factor 4-like isoform X1 [Hyperionvirus sp.]|uniref:Serine/arginine-rich splicing factor 4-like isoform X1 n=1 Tax=Hyperionvirus sp. TaxID=2487770 RepID=A0A3G5A5S9_9VIRU|nr:MAG: serine/arginine-rich splicing factor 4-like isoform X1 [Hyperionvirus sp.]